MTIAVIPARGGSKRLPGKNTKEFCGHPLVAWTITQAKCSKNIDAVFVSTDDEEIAAIAGQYGASVIPRPEWPDANEASAIRPIAHAVQALVQKYGAEFDELVAILPTNPLNKPGDFDAAIEAYRQYGADCVIPLRPMREMNIHKKINSIKCRSAIADKSWGYLGESGSWVVCSPNYYLTMSRTIESDLDKEVDREAEHGGATNYYVPMEVWQYADADTLEDFNFAQVVMDYYILRGAGMQPYTDYALKHRRPSIDLSRYSGNHDQLEGRGGGN